MELSPAARPIHALQLIHKHGPFNTPNGDRQSKRVRLHLAGQWTNDRQSACSVVTQICQDQGWPALCLYPANLGIEIYENDISGVRNVRCPERTVSPFDDFPSDLRPERHFRISIFRSNLSHHLSQGRYCANPVQLHNPIGAHSNLQRVSGLKVSVLRHVLRNPHSQAISPFQHLCLHVHPYIYIVSPPRG